MWTFSSQIAFGLQIIHPNQFKIHLETEILLFECLYHINQQILAIKLEFTCAPIYLTNEWGENCIDFICLALQPVRNMDTKNH